MSVALQWHVAFQRWQAEERRLDSEMARGQEFVREFNEGDEEARSLARGVGPGSLRPDTPAEALRRIPL